MICGALPGALTTYSALCLNGNLGILRSECASIECTYLLYMVAHCTVHAQLKYSCSTTGKPTHLFRTKCASLDSV